MIQALKIAGVVIATTIALLALLVSWPAAHAPLPATHPLLAITNVHVVDVRAGEASAPQTVLIKGGRISSIGPAPAPLGAFRLDAQGGYLMPGLWDMHSHSWQVSPQLHFPLQIANGVTGVRDMMDCPEASDPLIACVADKRR